MQRGSFVKLSNYNQTELCTETMLLMQQSVTHVITIRKRRTAHRSIRLALLLIARHHSSLLLRFMPVGYISCMRPGVQQAPVVLKGQNFLLATSYLASSAFRNSNSGCLSLGWPQVETLDLIFRFGIERSKRSDREGGRHFIRFISDTRDRGEKNARTISRVLAQLCR